jgi:hypothetical protein
MRQIRNGLLIGLAALALATAGHAKPPQGGGNTEPTGTIYFSDSQGFKQMNPDGSGKMLVPIGRNPQSPSRTLHGGRRWFIQTRNTAGTTLPDGRQQWDLYAVRGDGDEAFAVRLTDDPTLERTGLADWAPGEQPEAATIGFMARRWVTDGFSWSVDPASVGVYTAIVRFDSAGNVIGLDAPPALRVSVGVVANPGDGSWLPDAYNSHFDWSPDLREIVLSNNGRSQLRAVEVATGRIRTITTGLYPYNATWSPTGDLILFGNGDGSIETVRPDGTGRIAVIKWGVSYRYFYPAWSPTGSHIQYIRDSSNGERDIFRATGAGLKQVNLTADLAGFASPLAWR